MSEPDRPLLPPGTGPKLLRAGLDFLAALIWFVASGVSGGSSTDLFQDGSDVFAGLALAGALITGVAFGLRMASIAVETVPDWVARVELWTWIALPIWFGLTVLVVRL